MDDEEWRQRRREYNRRYNELHPERRKASIKKYNAKTETKERKRAWVTDNPDKDAASKRNWYEQNRELVNSKTKEYRLQNPGFSAKHCAKRRSRKLNATPSWLSEDDLWIISEIYELAALRTEATGVTWHVDHIVPLQGKKVCGLHVPWNMQVITASENSRKSNKLNES